MMTDKTPEVISLEQEYFGGHVQHWQNLADDAEQQVPNWLHVALDQAEQPTGLSSAKNLPSDIWLLSGPKGQIQVVQLIEIESSKPKALKVAYPILQSPYHIQAKIQRIIQCEALSEAVLQLETDDGTIYAFDTLYAVNRGLYRSDINYQVQIGAFAHELELVGQEEQMEVTDEAAIRHHRALNSILAEYDGVAPDNLQQLISEWQPETEDDKAPLTLDLAKMVAYLYGDQIGQEDEAWIQGEVLGVSTTDFMQQEIVLYDVAILREYGNKPVVLRLAYKKNHKLFQVGDYIRGNIWIQACIYDNNVTV